MPSPDDLRSLVLLNPGSGGGKGARYLPQVRAAVESFGGELCVTTAAEEATVRSREAVRAGRPMVVAAGGDDTVRGVLQGMFYRGSPLLPPVSGLARPAECPLPTEPVTALGIVPLGTFNNFATYLRLPWDPVAAVKVAFTGRTGWVDLGRLDDGIIFTESVGVGLNVEAWLNLEREESGLPQRIYYGLRSFLRAFYFFRPKRLQVRIDGTPMQIKATDLTVANSSHFASGLMVAPNAVVDDGLLDVCILPPMSKLGFLLAIPLFVLGMHPRLPDVHYSQAREIRISASRPYPVRVDGRVSRRLPITVEVLPRALPVRLV